MELIVALLKAFVVGGCICVIAQLFIELTPYSITPAHILVGYVVSGAVISALGLYQPIVDFAGAGATIPLSGFGHLLMQGVIEAVGEEGLKGVFTGGLTAASMGITVAMLMGFTMALIFQPKG
ncbi:MAG: stage V sporulation protein AE [Peptococcaceae bacterium]|nr:stage V sporulation protein AE [Peptococcaceae bacterium]MBQ2993887.1 stage V sporulation protein AE [Peptococcaceae bacterium]MBQ7026228.1 stage V sporulation protein AE [Peptococcaceae bacterium]